MKPKRKCILYRERDAVLPDRERPGRPVKRVCRECHATRLLDDLHRILYSKAKM